MRSKQVLIPEVRQDARRLKSGKVRLRGRWDVTARLPSLEGTLDARIIGAMMTAEVIDEIRARWASGRDAQGNERELWKYTPRHRRRLRAILREVLEWGPHSRAARALLRNYTQTRFVRVDVDGVKTRVRQQRIWWPAEHEPARPLMDSGMMYHTLHGRWRNRPRTVTIDGRRVAVAGSIRLQVAGPRAYWANIYGGLNARAASAFERMALPQTRRLLENAIWWRNIDRVGRGFRDAMRGVALVSRVARRLT